VFDTIARISAKFPFYQHHKLGAALASLTLLIAAVGYSIAEYRAISRLKAQSFCTVVPVCGIRIVWCVDCRRLRLRRTAARGHGAKARRALGHHVGCAWCIRHIKGGVPALTVVEHIGRDGHIAPRYTMVHNMIVPPEGVWRQR